MKKIFLSMLAIATLTFTSCSDDDNSDNNPVNTVTIEPADFRGSLESGETATLDPSKVYLLNGPFTVKSGAKLIIPAGTVIKATEVLAGDTNGVRYIAVAQGGKIFVNGTATNPVIMTSNKAVPAPSDWGGLVICGKANTNKSGSTGQTATAEVSDLTYGGTVSNDDSGDITYLRIEYSGYAYSSTKEFNGLSLFGVGSETKIENVQTRYNGDDGIEFFGGTVNPKNLVITNSEDDALDFADGYAGTIENVYIKHVAKAGVEGSNNGENGNATPVTNAILKNLTILKGDLAGSEHGMYIKEGGGKWNCQNIYIGGFTTGIKIKSAAEDAPANGFVTAGDVTFNPIYFETSVTTQSEYTGTNTTYLTVGSNTGAGSGSAAPSWSNTWSIIQ
jgi:hypothetical protein